MDQTAKKYGLEFEMDETKNEVILSIYVGGFQVQNIFKKDTDKDEEVLSKVETTLKNAVQDYLENNSLTNK
ncbi:hypothetical protein [Mesobacillus jeotgali]|uniref:hypothetical protein n=1 Tax=Mesobacillus jeotgali TaxID=129985 RepID=UPI000C83F343|nr:hypothetical protein [Mesobacillus jeotgali]